MCYVELRWSARSFVLGAESSISSGSSMAMRRPVLVSQAITHLITHWLVMESKKS
jgi:hypothetical protein